MTDGVHLHRARKRNQPRGAHLIAGPIGQFCPNTMPLKSVARWSPIEYTPEFPMALRDRTHARMYQLRHRIAAGGMGEIYEAVSPDLKRRVAVKRMLEPDTTDRELKTLFLREVAVAATLGHPNVVEVIDAGQVDDNLYLVMEFVEGPSLAETLWALERSNKVLPVEVACGIVGSIARGLAHAHERALPDGTPLGIVHRDVAAENVLLVRNGVPKIFDFGLAKLSGHSMTIPGTIRGRPRNLAPEQARGSNVDARSDIFSLGALLFELLSGQPLYPSEELASLLWKVAAGKYEPIEDRLGNTDPDLVAIVKQAIAVAPEARFRSAREFSGCLDRFRAGRGMRADIRSTAKIIADLWPLIARARKRRLQGARGEIEGLLAHTPA